nr:3'-5' exonuclease [Streptomyces sp. A13(2022)]
MSPARIRRSTGGEGEGRGGATCRTRAGGYTCAKVVARLNDAGVPAVSLRNANTDSAEQKAVRVCTMHSFKGLEFRCVALVGVNDGALPFPRAITPEDMDSLQHEADLMSERCLLFVACARARDSLYVSWPGERSTFLTEAGVVGA